MSRPTPDRWGLPVCAAVLTCTGCFSPNLYTTPKILDRGDVRGTVAVEAFDHGQTVPFVPAMRLRVGLGGRTEAQVGLSPQTVAGGFAFGLVQSRWFDLAVLPQLTLLAPFSGRAGGQADAIALLGVQWSDVTTLLLNGGIGHVIGSPKIPTRVGIETDPRPIYPSGVVARLGVGIQWRVGKRFSLQPEFTFQRYLGDPKVNVYAFGLGFQFGAQPYP